MAEEIIQGNPEGAGMPGGAGIPPAEEGGDKESQWSKVDLVVNAAKESFLAGEADFNTVLDTLISTLQKMKGTKGMGGLGIEKPMKMTGEEGAGAGAGPAGGEEIIE